MENEMEQRTENSENCGYLVLGPAMIPNIAVLNPLYNDGM